MAKCIERQLADLIPIPSTGAASAQKRAVTPRPDLPPIPTFVQRFFILALGSGPVWCDHRIRSNHPFNICRNLVHQVDTPLFPPADDRRSYYVTNLPSCSSSSNSTSTEAVANHLLEWRSQRPPVYWAAQIL